MAYFDVSLLKGTQRNEYVCFLDIMGMKKKMTKSINQASNMIFKLHAAILEVVRKSGYENVSIYPIMDGAYITAKSKQDMLTLLTYIYCSLAKNFTIEREKEHLYLCRAAVSFGPVIHGRNVPYKASLEFGNRVGYKEQILIGKPMIYAYTNEHNAAPFGIFIDRCACGKKGDIDKNWHWYKNTDVEVPSELIEKLSEKLDDYFTWCAENNLYEQEKIEQHRDAAREYFAMVK